LIAGAIKKIMESNAHPNNYHSWVMGSDNE
jgi:hypothetical protein